MRRTDRNAAIALIIIATILAIWLFARPHAAGASRTVHTPVLPTSACTGAAPQRVNHVISIWFENASYDRIIGSPGSTAARLHPFFNRMARRCATLRHMSAMQHASLGNYIAAATGSAAGIHGGCSPSECPITRTSIFEQLAASGQPWRSYQESLPAPCLGRDSGRYAVRHDPVPYLTRIASACRASDVPLGTLAAGRFATALDTATLPAFAMITPDLCNDGHDCTAAHADLWMAHWLPRIVRSAAYRRGDVVIIATWDEGDRYRAPGVLVNTPCPHTSLRADCHIPTIVVAPSITPGTHIDHYTNHVDLLQLTQLLLGVAPPLGTRHIDPRVLASDLNLRSG